MYLIIDWSKLYTIAFKFYITFVQLFWILYNFAHVWHNFVSKIVKFFRLQEQELRFYPISEAAQLSNRSEMTWRICGGNQGSRGRFDAQWMPSSSSFALFLLHLYCIFRIDLCSDTAMQEEHEERDLVLLKVDFIMHIWLTFYINLSYNFDTRFIQIWHTNLTYVFIQIWNTNLTYVLRRL